MRVSIDDTMLSVSVTRVRRSGAFGVVVVVVAIVILFTCCDIAKFFHGFIAHRARLSGLQAPPSSCGRKVCPMTVSALFLVQDWFT